MRILITGAAGFVGKHLIDYLKKDTNNEIFALVLNVEESTKVELASKYIFQSDITNKETTKTILGNIQPDQIFHLAAQSSVGLSWKIPSVTFRVNVEGTINILESLIENDLKKCKVLLIGSSEQYGTVLESELPIVEEHSLSPVNPYCISKISQEMIANMYVKNYGLDITMVRAFNHIGPGQADIFVISSFAKQIASIEKGDKKPVIEVGNLSAKRDFTDVRDIVRAYSLLAQNGKSGEVYNVGSGKSTSIEYVLKMLLGFSSKDISVKIDKERFRVNDVNDIYADCSKIFLDVGWGCEISLDKALLEVLDYWRGKSI